MSPFNLSVFRCLLKRLTWTLCALGVSIALLAGFFWVFCIQSQPLSVEPPAVSKAQLVQQIKQDRLLSRTLQGEAMHFTLLIPQLNALMNDLAQRAIGGRASLKAQETSFELVVSIPTARTPLRRWLPNDWFNIHSHWLLGPEGLPYLKRAQWGRLPIPAGLVNWLFDRGLAHYKLRAFADIAIQSIKQVSVSPSQLSVRWHWRNDLKARTFAALIPPSELSRIHVYQQALVKHIQLAEPVAAEHGGNIPLLTIMKPLFQLAQQRTLVKQMNADDELSNEQLPINENRAALLVLAMHALRIEFPSFVPQAKGWPQALPYPLTLRDRIDFSQHYLMSALIASGMGGRVADLIGIYKEQSDKVAGSGFSFNDIAADRAGVRLGQQARQAAQQLQRRIQEGEDEDFFMPDVSDMPQFLTADEFAQRYSGANSGAYIELLSLIDARVNQLGVLR
jgi:hypothetical protein